MRQMTMAVLGAVLAIGLLGCEPTRSGPAAEGKVPKIALRVNAGADKPYTDSKGTVWLPDQEYKEGAKYGALGGKVTTRTALAAIPGSKDSPLYLAERYGMDAYRFDVPNGKYTVRLHFCETYERINAPGQRVFSVAIQGKPALADFDPLKEAGKFAAPVVKEFKGVVVADGKLMIEFTPKVQHPNINAIEVLGH